LPTVEDILEHLHPDIQRRVRQNWTEFEPFVGLLSAWTTVLDQHLMQVEKHVVERLNEGFLPGGSWRFPAQTLAIPETLRLRDIAPAESPFTDEVARVPWTACGPGWTLPSGIVRWETITGPSGQAAAIFHINYQASDQEAPLITPQRGQLAFVAGTERLVAALADASWAVQHPGRPWQPAVAERYRGYLEFEEELFVARPAQPHLEAWLPPCHPYSRKFLHVRADASAAETRAPDWDWVAQASPFPAADGDVNVRLAVLLDRRLKGALDAHTGPGPLILNGVPVAQMGLRAETLVTTLHNVGDTTSMVFPGLASFFVATARQGRQPQPAKFSRETTRDPRAAILASEEARLDDVTVSCGRGCTEVRAYCDCHGAQPSRQPPGPPSLLLALRDRFQTPFPALGGVDRQVSAGSEGASRYYWYHTLLRPRLLTEGDVRENLASLPLWDYFDRGQLSIQLDVHNSPPISSGPWESFLWPSLVQEATLDGRAAELTASRVPIIPVLRLLLTQKSSECPAFLLDDLARYSASVLSGFFIAGWYRVEGSVANAPPGYAW
jgi:hypothetical protein